MRPSPTCSRCGADHWNFQECKAKPKPRPMGYDMIKKTSDYQRTQYRERPRMHYHENHYEGRDDYDDAA